MPKFQKYGGRKGNTKEHVMLFLDSWAPFHDANLCIR